MKTMARVATLGNLAGVMQIRMEESSIIAELKAGSEEAYCWLITQFQTPIYSLVYRILNDPGDAADTTQEVFLKVFRGMRQFNGDSSLKTWIYRIAVHEASNRRRWWFRHESKETSIDRDTAEDFSEAVPLKDTLVDEARSPFDNFAQSELRDLLEAELRQVPEPYRTTVVLRDIEELSYEEIAEVMEATLGTVKSRLTRGRSALRKRLEKRMPQVNPEFNRRSKPMEREAMANNGREVEVAS